MVRLLRCGRAAMAVLLLSGVAWALSACEVALAGTASPAVHVSSHAAAVSPHAAVETLRIPEGGRLPRAVVDTGGTVHLVYVGDGTTSANLFHVTRAAGAPGWSEPQRINTRELSVSGVGPIDGAQLALGRDDRLHIAWVQTEPAAFFYTRSRANGSGFEPQRDLATGEEGAVEAGPAVAADRRGNVYVFWHAGAVEDARRSVYLTVSHDAGGTFEPPRRISSEAEGACACCGLAAVTDPGGAIHVSYRGAGDNVRRGQRLLTSTDRGGNFSDRLVDPWELGGLPRVDHESVRRPCRPDGGVGNAGPGVLRRRRPARRRALTAGGSTVPAQEPRGRGGCPGRYAACVGRRAGLQLRGFASLAGLRRRGPCRERAGRRGR